MDRSSSRCHAWSRSRIHQNPLLARGMWWRCVMTRTVGGSDRGRVGACEWWSSIKYRDEIRCSSQISGYLWRTNDQRGRVCGREHHGSSAGADSVMSESIVVLCCIVPLRSGLHWSKSCRGDDSQHSRCSLHSPLSPQRESCLIRCGHVPKRLSAHPRPTPPPEGAVFAVARRRRGGTTHHGARVGWGTSGLCRFCSRRCTARSPSLTHVRGRLADGRRRGAARRRRAWPCQRADADAAAPWAVCDGHRPPRASPRAFHAHQEQKSVAGQSIEVRWLWVAPLSEMSARQQWR